MESTDGDVQVDKRKFLQKKADFLAKLIICGHIFVVEHKESPKLCRYLLKRDLILL